MVELELQAQQETQELTEIQEPTAQLELQAQQEL